MSNVLTKQVQNRVSRYFLHLENYLSKPESRCVREMTTGILKSDTSFSGFQRSALRSIDRYWCAVRFEVLRDLKLFKKFNVFFNK